MFIAQCFVTFVELTSLNGWSQGCPCYLERSEYGMGVGWFGVCCGLWWVVVAINTHHWKTNLTSKVGQ